MRPERALLAFLILLLLTGGPVAQERNAIRVTPAGGDIGKVAYSTDGLRLLSVSNRQKLTVWDATTGALLRTLQLEKRNESYSPAALSPDGSRAVSIDRDKKLRLWDVTTGAPLLTLECECAGEPVFSPDGLRILSPGKDKKIKVWDAQTGTLLRTFGQYSAPAVFSHDGSRVLAPSGWGNEITLNLWDTTTGSQVRTFEGHPGPRGTITSIAFSSDGSRVLSGSYDMTMRLWDATTGALLRTFSGHTEIVASVAIAPNGGRVLSGSNDGTMKLWDVATGALVHSFPHELPMRPHTWVGSVSFSPDGLRVISSADGILRVWNAQTGQLLAIMTTADELWMHHGDKFYGEWAAITPEGFFAASPKGGLLVQVGRYPDRFTSSDTFDIVQFHQSLFNPDLVREALAGDPNGEVRDAAEVLNLEKVVNSGPTPRVEIVSHPSPSPKPHQTQSGVVSLQARITDRGKGVGRIEWRVNRITAAVAAKPAAAGPVYTIKQELALEPGDNLIELVAYNASNLMASHAARTTITFTGQTHQTMPNLYVLAIGINAYKDGGWLGPRGDDSIFEPLALARKDAETFAEQMRLAATGHYGKVRVVMALDEQATRANLDKLIDQIGREMHPRDTFLLFAAAHGKSIDGRYYLIPQDYDGGGDPAALAAHAVDQSMLQDWLANRIKARKAVVFLDTCESGALIAGHTRARTGTTTEAAVGRLHEATGRPVLTASAMDQYAYEDPVGRTGARHGLFTWALLQALRDGDANRNGLIELSELVAYVQDQVPKLATQLGGIGSTKSAAGGAMIPDDFKQQARFGSRGEDFVLARKLP